MPRVSKEKMTAYIVSCIDAGDRKYVYSDSVEASTKKTFTFVPYDKKLLRYAEDEFGTISDAFVLMAITSLGVADKNTIFLYLEALSRTDPNLQIADYVRYPAALGNRLSELRKSGFLFCFEYKATMYEEGKTPWIVPNMLYTVDQDGQNFCNSKLNNRMPFNQWIQAKQMNELLGWSAATYCGVSLAHNANFVAFEKGLFKSREIGSVFLPVELRFKKDDALHYVAVLPSYVRFDDRIMSKQDYNNYRGMMIKVIGNYLQRRSNGTLYVVVVVEDNNDLKGICNIIAGTGVFDGLLDRLFFTGEGAILHADHPRKALLRMQVKEDHTYTLSAVEPEFMKD